TADRTGRVRAGGVEPEPTVDDRRRRARDPAQRARPLALARLRPLQAAALARLLDLRGPARADDRGRVAVEVLTPLVVDAVVVGPQEAADHRARRRGPIGERLAGEHRRQLHHARALARRRVLALPQTDRLVVHLDKVALL